MNNYEQFTEDEIPYEILQKYGLSQQMISDLPQTVMQRLLSGKRTPVLPVEYVNNDGDKVRSLVKISLVRLPDGNVDVCFAPRWENADLSDFTPEVQDALNEGKVSMAIMPGKGSCFVQFDDTINQVIAVPVSIIIHNITLLAQEYDMDEEDRIKLEDGELIEIQVKDLLFTAGIDLNEASGIRIVKGDTIAWKEDVIADRLPRYSFGISGCWVADDNNMLTYVPDDDYTEKMLKEFNRQGACNGAQAQARQMGIS